MGNFERMPSTERAFVLMTGGCGKVLFVSWLFTSEGLSAAEKPPPPGAELQVGNLRPP